MDTSLYQRLGGEQPLKHFVERLYHHMDSLAEVKHVRDMHSLSLDEAGLRLFRFLSGMLGGPPLFHQHYGEPMLRRRHLHLQIGDSERDQWMLCARRAAADMDWPQPVRGELLQRLQEMADHLRNSGQQIRGCRHSASA